MSKIIDNVLHGSEEPEYTEGTELPIYRLLDSIQEELRATGDRDWIIDAVTESSVRISHILGRSSQVASGLTRLGFKKGDCLQAFYGTNTDFYWPIFGAWLCGGVASSSDPWLDAHLLASQIQDTKAFVIVTLKCFAEKVLTANQSLPEDIRAKHVLLLDADPWETLPEGAASFRNLYNDDGQSCPSRASLLPYIPENPCLINWTSGTSGKPKGVVHSNQYLHRMLRTSKLPPFTTALMSNILFHAGALLLPLDGGIFNKFTVCVIKEEDFSAKICLEKIQTYKPIFYMCGTNHFVEVVNSDPGSMDLSSLKIMMPAGGKVSEAARAQAKKTFPGLACIFQFYGSTEVGGVSWTMTGSGLGQLRSGVQVYIRDKETGKKLGPNQTGEIMAKTPTMMLEYLNRKEDTEAFTDENGFSFMGDLGHYDEAGILYYKERAKEMMKVGNFWIGPGQIEEELLQHPDVMDCVVFGIVDPTTGFDIIHAAVVLEAEVNDDLALLDSIRTATNQRLNERLQIQGSLHRMDKIPTNPQGKKLRRVVKEMFKQSS